METTNENKITPRPETYREQIAQNESVRSSRDSNDPEESQSNEEDLASTPLEETDTSEEDAQGERYNYGSLDHERNRDYSNPN